MPASPIPGECYNAAAGQHNTSDISSHQHICICNKVCTICAIPQQQEMPQIPLLSADPFLKAPGLSAALAHLRGHPASTISQVSPGLLVARDEPISLSTIVNHYASIVTGSISKRAVVMLHAVLLVEQGLQGLGLLVSSQVTVHLQVQKVDSRQVRRRSVLQHTQVHVCPWAVGCTLTSHGVLEIWQINSRPGTAVSIMTGASCIEGALAI